MAKKETTTESTSDVDLSAVSRSLDCALTDEERLARYREAAGRAVDQQKAENKRDQARELAKAADADVKGIGVEIGRLLRVAQTGVEQRDVPCQWRYIREENVVVLFRADTNVEVERRAPTPDDWVRIRRASQRTFPYKDPPAQGELPVVGETKAGGAKAGDAPAAAPAPDNVVPIGSAKKGKRKDKGPEKIHPRGRRRGKQEASPHELPPEPKQGPEVPAAPPATPSDSDPETRH